MVSKSQQRNLDRLRQAVVAYISKIQNGKQITTLLAYQKAYYGCRLYIKDTKW